MAIRQDIGIVTAYGYAVSKGYEGTEEEFAQALADVGINVSEIEASIKEFNEETVPAAMQSIIDEGNTRVANVTAEGTRQMNAVAQRGANEILAVENAGTTQIGLVNEAGASQVEAVNSAGTTQVGNVNTAGGTQVAAVQAKGQEVIDSIPSDYSELTQEVSDLNQNLNNVDARFKYYTNVSDLTLVDSVTGTAAYKKTKTTLQVSNVTAESRLYIPVTLEIGKIYVIHSDFNVSGNAVFRMYASDKTTRFNFDDGTYLKAVETTMYIYAYNAVGSTLSVNNFEIVPMTNEYQDYLKQSYIPEEVENFITDKAITWEPGTINSVDGSLVDSSTIYRSDRYSIKSGYTYKLQGTGIVYRTYFYDEDGVYTGQYISTEHNSYVSEIDGFAISTIQLQYYESNLKLFEIISIKDKINNYNPTNTRTIVSQIDVINSVTNRIIDTQVTEVQSGRNASLYGFLPSNTAAQNTAALQALLDVGGNIIVDVIGDYEINGLLKIGSNTNLIFGEGTALKRVSDAGFIINKGAYTKEYDTNIGIFGLKVKCNGYGVTNTVVGMRGILSFYYAKNVIIDGIECLDVPTHQSYFMHFCNVENISIRNGRIAGGKDGMDFQRAKHIYIGNCVFDTLDDCIAFNTVSYLNGCPEIGNVEDAVIEKITEIGPGSPVGFFLRMIAGSWLDWASGNEYQNSDIVVNDGNIYRMIGINGSTSTMTASDPPTHLSGDVTGSDGITWRFIQTGTMYHTECKNIMLRDIYLIKNRVEKPHISLHYDIDGYSRTIYPGSVAMPHENIIFENINMIGTALNFVQTMCPVKNMKMFNSRIKSTWQFWRFTTLYDLIVGVNDETRITMVGNTVDQSTSMRLVNVQGGRYVSMNDGFNEKTVACSRYGTVTIINDDLMS